MPVDRSSLKWILASWVALAVVLTLLVHLIYDGGWAAMTRVPHPSLVRAELVGLVLAVSLVANLLLRATRASSDLRLLCTWVVVSAVVCVTGFWFGDNYLGGAKPARIDLSGFHFLMYEGWGMMFPFFSTIFGLLAAVREGLEVHTPRVNTSLKKRSGNGTPFAR